jgi:hypothetical protein
MDDRELFWAVLEAALSEVFHDDPASAQRLKADLAGASESERSLFFHAEPLDVAADLSGVVPTESQVLQYRHLLGRLAPEAKLALRAEIADPWTSRRGDNQVPAQQLTLF